MGAAAVSIPVISALSQVKAAALDFSTIKTVEQFGKQVIGRADLSRLACEIALKQSVRADAKEFATYELMEAETVIDVLNHLGVATPVMGKDALGVLDHIRNSEGVAFDKAYIGAEYENHVFLRDLASAYLKNSAGSQSVDERHGRQLASLALFAFTEHAAITHRISQSITA
ncbi:DUF4142 domain-containing protein [Mesorhizobium sp. VK9D]|uniref:DUF4142 domain-containing protein n=1 Tax=Mesorhizobium australafricanum TaxID=3072311 RepID=UPI002A23D40A|nr:DUF4142 domain-containing protein [Mesorhizobium sp. VK9D]MDX8456270.1 DUF4142 domain-containing protein [Mesorhizobium sp. VK9D]